MGSSGHTKVDQRPGKTKNVNTKAASLPHPAMDARRNRARGALWQLSPLLEHWVHGTPPSPVIELLVIDLNQTRKVLLLTFDVPAISRNVVSILAPLQRT